jgi:hypothetical protein
MPVEDARAFFATAGGHDARAGGKRTRHRLCENCPEVYEIGGA